MPITIEGTPVAVPTYNSPLVVVGNGYVYIAYPGSPTLNLCSNQATAPLDPTVLTSMCFLNNTIFIVDGTTIQTLPLEANFSLPTVIPYLPGLWVASTSYSVGQYVTYVVSGVTNIYQNIVATSGSTAPNADATHWAPLGAPPTDCFMCCNWRGRFVLAGDKNNPQNFYMARVGQPYDWNYAALDPAAAVAGNLSESGQIGEPIVALIPYTDDYMLIGCTNSLWMLQGDPADGGSIVRVSDSMGLVSPNSWCVDPAGTLYFIARGGLYSVRPIWEFYQPPQLLSGETYDQYFQQLINGSYYISMEWDVDYKYMHIFATPTVEIGGSPTAGIHLIFDQRNGGLWPQQYSAYHGPTATTKYTANNNTAGQRAILLGGWDGYIRQWTNSALNDTSVPIASYATLGPLKASPEASIFSAITIDFGEVGPGDTETQWNVLAQLNAGPDAYSVTEGIPHSTYVVANSLDRRSKTYRQRFRSGWISLQLSNTTLDTYWSFESALLEFSDGGRNRERR